MPTAGRLPVERERHFSGCDRSLPEQRRSPWHTGKLPEREGSVTVRPGREESDQPSYGMNRPHAVMWWWSGIGLGILLVALFLMSGG